MITSVLKKAGLLIFTTLLFACESPNTSWFPLSEGYWWRYSAVRSIKGEAHLQKLIIANLPALKINGETVFPKKRADGQIEYYQKTDTAIYRYDPDDGSKTLLLQEPIKVGTKWQAKSKILFLEVTGAFEATYNRKIKDDIIIEYEIDSINDEVKVAAGRFINCIRVKGFGSIYGGGGSLEEFMDIDTINVETVEWYAPGVGLVKRTRKEYTRPLEFENNYLEELESIKTG